MVLLALNAMAIPVFLNRLVTFLIRGLWYIKVIQNTKEKEIAKQSKRPTRKNEKKKEQTEQTSNKKWVTFTYHSPLIR
jgi:uncharacterized ion transporter superfamily protein YfcC